SRADVDDGPVREIGFRDGDVMRAGTMTPLAADSGVGGFGTRAIPVRVAKRSGVGHVAIQAADNAVANVNELSARVLDLVGAAGVSRGSSPTRFLGLVEVGPPQGPVAAVAVPPDHRHTTVRGSQSVVDESVKDPVLDFRPPAQFLSLLLESVGHRGIIGIGQRTLRTGE